MEWPLENRGLKIKFGLALCPKSSNMQKQISTSFRAIATMAMFLPRRRMMTVYLHRSSALLRIATQAAWMSTRRTILDPCFVIGPSRFVLEDSYSRGTNPK